MASTENPATGPDAAAAPAAQEFWRTCQHLAYHLDNAPVAVVVWDAELRVTRWNEAAERLFGWTAAEVTGRRLWPDWAGFFPPGEWEAVVAPAAERVRSGAERAVVVTNRNLTKGGEVRVVEWRNSVLTDPAGKVASVLSFALDVTGRPAEDSDLAAQAGAVAHDLNNVFTVVLGNVGLARRELPPAAAAHLDPIEQAGVRGAELCHRLTGLAGRARDPGEAARKPRPAPAPPRREAARALVADDEMFVRELMASTLEDLGYEPLLAAAGPAALELFRQYPGEIRVAVLDVRMPGLRGDQLLAELRVLSPGLPAVLVSGLPDPRADRGAGDERTVFLPKPFRPEDLAAAVRQVIGGVQA
jgi:PAS domain S-box-containing protein